MEQYGFNYEAPHHGYQHPPQPATPYGGLEHGTIATQSNGALSQQSYQYNRDMIPGLGLGYPGPATEYSAPLHEVPNQTDTPPRLVPAEQFYSAEQWQEVTAQQHAPSLPQDLLTNEARYDFPSGGTEEGEISDGELEDLYDPSDIRNSEYNPVATSGKPAVSRQRRAIEEGRERSGSYSPYLSPRELQTNINNNQELNLEMESIGMDIADDISAHRHSSQSDGHLNAAPAPVRSLDSARSDALHAIARLQPLSIRFRDYLDEGIDAAVVEDLFKALGYEPGVPEAVSAVQDPPVVASTKMADGHVNVGDTPLERARVESQEAASAVQPEKPKNKSEERKDRIARLLAAKGSKAAGPSSDAVPRTSPVPSKKVLPKTQSEKSKLIQQRMEALERARKAQAQERSQQDAQASSAIKETPKDVLPSPPANDSSRSTSAPSAPEEATGQNGRVPASASIPGLFLSSKSSGHGSQRKRPVASDFDDANEPPVVKRPFGQARVSRPFFIHVSDDEDEDEDTEMDIESPAQQFSSLKRPSPPSNRTPSFHDAATLSDRDPARRASSPIHNADSPAIGSVELESVNKKIEDLKRRIAEAEARKEAKQPQQDSPLPMPPSQIDNVNHLALQTLAGIEAEANLVAGAPPGTKSPVLSIKAHDKRETTGTRSRSRSRAASERLSVIEAYRREKMLRLQSLQSQVASIQKELEENIMEEQMLKNEAAKVSDFEVAPAAQGAEPNIVSGEPDGLSLLEEMDFAAHSASQDEQPGPDVPVTISQEGPQSLVADEPSVDPAIPAHSTTREESSDGNDGNRSSNQDPSADPAAESQRDTAFSNEVPSAAASISDGLQVVETTKDEESPGKSVSQGQPKSSASSSHGVPTAEPMWEISDGDEQALSTVPLVPQQISAGHEDVIAEWENQAQPMPETPAQVGPLSSFQPYESPLQYFRAFRFHPDFNRSVAGGLRSLTYSNKIDIRQALCPDQLAGQPCPRGSECDFQHFENLQAADDQILLQLGDYTDYGEDQKQEYISGLRTLLTDFRERKIKDFATISQGIVDYRAQFQQDKSKILPLGNVRI